MDFIILSFVMISDAAIDEIYAVKVSNIIANYIEGDWATYHGFHHSFLFHD